MSDLVAVAIGRIFTHDTYNNLNAGIEYLLIHPICLISLPSVGNYELALARPVI
jgi:hypothetical protein